MKPLPALLNFHKMFWLIISLLVFNGIIDTARAAQAYDECSGAIVIPSTGSFPFVTNSPLVDMSQTLALSPNDPPLPTTPGFDTNITHSVWF